MAAGYSETPLVKKLGIKPGMRVRLLGPPEHYADLLGPLPEDVVVVQSTRGRIDFCHLFARSQAELRRRLPAAVKHLAADGMLWLSWPKKASSLETDLTEATIRRAGLDAGLVDVKICAVDGDWSGLKFVYRLKDRPKHSG